jgi:hypothetical protein
MGSDLGREPVAMMMCFAVSVRFSAFAGFSSPWPAFLPPTTSILPPPSNRAQPCTCSTLFFLKR